MMAKVRRFFISSCKVIYTLFFFNYSFIFLIYFTLVKPQKNSSFNYIKICPDFIVDFYKSYQQAKELKNLFDC